MSPIRYRYQELEASRRKSGGKPMSAVVRVALMGGGLAAALVALLWGLTAPKDSPSKQEGPAAVAAVAAVPAEEVGDDWYSSEENPLFKLRQRLEAEGRYEESAQLAAWLAGQRPGRQEIRTGMLAVNLRTLIQKAPEEGGAAGAKDAAVESTVEKSPEAEEE